MRIADASEQCQYLQRWKALGPILDTMRLAELRHMTEENYLQTMEQLWSVAVAPAERNSSGLVEWQRLLRR